MAKYIFCDENGELLWECDAKSIKTAYDDGLIPDGIKKQLAENSVNFAKALGFKPRRDDIQT